MIYAFVGIPGSGKTYEAIEMMLDNLRCGRKIYTNIDGLEDERCREHIKCFTQISYFGLKVHLNLLTNEEAQEFWLHCEPGSLIIIDETHKLFSNRDWQTAKNKNFANWASTHRHEGYDLVLITQDLSKIDSHVRTLVGWTYVYRKVNFMGRMFENRYLKYVYAGDETTGSPISTEKHAYNPKIFRCYKSYVTDEIKELKILKSVNILRHPVFIAIPILFVFTMYMFFARSSFATGDLFGSKKVMERAATITTQGETATEKPTTQLIDEESANEESASEELASEEPPQHIYRYIDSHGVYHDTNRIENIPPKAFYYKLI